MSSFSAIAMQHQQWNKFSYKRTLRENRDITAEENFFLLVSMSIVVSNLRWREMW